MKQVLSALLLLAVSACCSWAFAEDVSIALEVTTLPDNRVRLHGRANLPPGTELMLSVAEKGVRGYVSQAKSVISEQGEFNTDALGPQTGFQEGCYIAEVVMPIPAVQPKVVQRAIGDDGENLTGPLVKKTALGTTVSQKTEFVIGRQPDKSQSTRTKQAEQKTAELKQQLCVYLEQLLGFKDDPRFREVGFAVAGPYHKWIKGVEALRAAIPREDNRIPFDLRTAPAELVSLGMAYMQKGETPYTQTTLPELKKTIDYESYLRTNKRKAR